MDTNYPQACVIRYMIAFVTKDWLGINRLSGICMCWAPRAHLKITSYIVRRCILSGVFAKPSDYPDMREIVASRRPVASRPNIDGVCKKFQVRRHCNPFMILNSYSVRTVLKRTNTLSVGIQAEP